MGHDAREFFTAGKVSVVLDGQAGSSGKGKIGSFLARYGTPSFGVNSFCAQAGHWVESGGKRIFYQTLNSAAHEGLTTFVGPDAIIELPALFREIDEAKCKPGTVRISPFAGILEPRDAAFERGEVDFEGRASRHDGTMKSGSTCHGVGAARARRVLRRARLAKDEPRLREFLCDVPGEVMDRLDRGESGMLEVAQGFQLSLLHRFYPHVTSRNVTVSAALDGVMLPPRYLGNVCLNFRTFPIRISSKKFLDENGRHLTQQDVEYLRAVGKPVRVIEGDSGPWYADQRELTWEEVTRDANSPRPIAELTSVTKLPRRVASFSHDNLVEAIRFNRPAAPHSIFLSVNFCNYVDHEMFARQGNARNTHDDPLVTPKLHRWLEAHVRLFADRTGSSADARRTHVNADEPTVRLAWLGTGPDVDHVVSLDSWPRGY